MQLPNENPTVLEDEQDNDKLELLEEIAKSWEETEAEEEEEEEEDGEREVGCIGCEFA